LQPTPIVSMILYVNIIEKVENVEGLLHYVYGMGRRRGAKVTL
jgi:hypothetical protein